MVATSGAPPGHAAAVAVVPLDDRGVAAGVATYPDVVDAADGSYRWTTRMGAGAVAPPGRLVADAGGDPVGPNGSLGGIVPAAPARCRSPPSPTPTRTVCARAVGDVVLSHRRGAGRWSPREVVVGGSGRQAVNAVVAHRRGGGRRRRRGHDWTRPARR